MISACIMTWKTCDIEGSSLETEDHNIEIKDKVYPKCFSACDAVILEGSVRLK